MFRLPSPLLSIGLVLKMLMAGAVFVPVVGCGKSTPSAFNAHMDDYVKAPNPIDNSPRPLDGVNPADYVLQPKLIPVDVDKRRVDADFYHAVPEEWRATTPDEVKTILQIRWKQVGETTKRNRKVPIMRCEITIIDKASNRQVADVQSERGVNPRSGEHAEFVKELMDGVMTQCRRFAKK